MLPFRTSQFLTMLVLQGIIHVMSPPFPPKSCVDRVLFLTLECSLLNVLEPPPPFWRRSSQKERHCGVDGE